jgi:hypothetical protein
MQQFLAPQFIDVEDKIIGPITIRQFVIMTVAVVLSAIEYRLLSFYFFIAAAVITLVTGAVFAFVKINGRPMHYFLLNFIQTLKRPFFRVWNKEAYVAQVTVMSSEIKEAKKEIARKETVSGSRLQDLSLIINTGGVYRPEEDVFEDVKGNKMQVS